jgi:hypothetical protein
MSSLLFTETLNKPMPETIKDVEKTSALRCFKKTKDFDENELK